MLAKNGDLNVLKQMVTETLPIDMIDSEGKTMLDLAAESEELDVVEFLVKCGAQIRCHTAPMCVQNKIKETLVEVKKVKFQKADAIQKCFATTIPQELCRQVIDYVPVYELMVKS